jgi:hypothetical protein
MIVDILFAGLYTTAFNFGNTCNACMALQLGLDRSV